MAPVTLGSGMAVLDDRLYADIAFRPINDIQNEIMRLFVDTGAMASTIRYSRLKEGFPHAPIKPTDKIFSGFDGTQTKSQGTVDLLISFKKKKLKCSFHLVPDTSLELLSWEHIKALGMDISGKNATFSVSPIHTVTPSPNVIPSTKKPEFSLKMQKIISDYPVLFKDDIGIIPDYEHSIVLKENACPIRMQCRRVPESRTEATKAALNQM
ncbi:MAG: hypothetical protein GY795_20235, partial [Desulfobacterales bacterium]|nr:hypothetical protein [Desulfobacterales bacterium]